MNQDLTALDAVAATLNLQMRIVREKSLLPAVSNEGLDWRDALILEILHRRPSVYVGELSQMLGVRENTMSENIKRLVKSGFVQKKRSKKLVLVTLTDKGQQAISKVIARSIDDRRKFISLLNLDGSERETLVRILSTASDILKMQTGIDLSDHMPGNNVHPERHTAEGLGKRQTHRRAVVQ